MMNGHPHAHSNPLPVFIRSESFTDEVRPDRLENQVGAGDNHSDVVCHPRAESPRPLVRSFRFVSFRFVSFIRDCLFTEYPAHN